MTRDVSERQTKLGKSFYLKNTLFYKYDRLDYI